jgi:sortase A
MGTESAWVTRTGIGRSLMVVGGVCLAWCAMVVSQTALAQRDQRRLLDRMLHDPAPPVHGPQALLMTPGDLVGAIDIPRLHLSATVIEGDDEAALQRAVGHLSDTPLPWQAGNSAFAAHRDTFFRSLKQVAVGDVIRVTTAHGAWTYRVGETLIVKPEDVWVLAPSERPMLTLITCYPFSYVGHAPQRFVVRAERIEATGSRGDTASTEAVSDGGVGTPVGPS